MSPKRRGRSKKPVKITPIETSNVTTIAETVGYPTTVDTKNGSIVLPIAGGGGVLVDPPSPSLSWSSSFASSTSTAASSCTTPKHSIMVHDKSSNGFRLDGTFGRRKRSIPCRAIRKDTVDGLIRLNFMGSQSILFDHRAGLDRITRPYRGSSSSSLSSLWQEDQPASSTKRTSRKSMTFQQEFRKMNDALSENVFVKRNSARLLAMGRSTNGKISSRSPAITI
jgi:hypothetical protein